MLPFTTALELTEDKVKGEPEKLIGVLCPPLGINRHWWSNPVIAPYVAEGGVKEIENDPEDPVPTKLVGSSGVFAV